MSATAMALSEVASSGTASGPGVDPLAAIVAEKLYQLHIHQTCPFALLFSDYQAAVRYARELQVSHGPRQYVRGTAHEGRQPVAINV